LPTGNYGKNLVIWVGKKTRKSGELIWELGVLLYKNQGQICPHQNKEKIFGDSSVK
jgi:hypothetical protein